jgi:gamma-glutamylcysteine synthetase
MNHDLTHEQITKEFNSIWEVISQLEDSVKEHLRQIEDIRRSVQEKRHTEGLIQVNEEAHIAQETDIQVP